MAEKMDGSGEPLALPDKALELIGSRSDGLLQSELRKLLGIESSKCSRIVLKLERMGLIRREKVSAGRARTYLIQRISSSKPSRGLQIDRYLTEIYLLYLIRGNTA